MSVLCCGFVRTAMEGSRDVPRLSAHHERLRSSEESNIVQLLKEQVRPLTVESYTIIISLQSLLIIIGIPSPTHSFTLGLNPYFSANPPYRCLSFFFFRIHYMDFPDCLLLLLSISVSLLFSFFSVFTLFQLSVPCGRLS